VIRPLLCRGRYISGSAAVSYRCVVLHEDAVVDAVTGFLVARGWRIEAVAHAHQRGDDIVAVRGDTRLIVEAKGEGSSKTGTKRFGNVFTGNQVNSHIGVAVLRALAIVSRGGALAALALPDNAHHRQRIDAIAPALTRLRVGIFWVSESAGVTLQAPWSS